MKKKVLSAFLAAAILLALCGGACAEDTSRSYLFDLSVNGSNEVTVEPGDVITVALYLKRTDSVEPSSMYAMQDEIIYDENCFRLVDKGGISADKIRTADLGRKDGKRAYYMNFVSVTGGEVWEAETMLGMFQLEVIGRYGRTEIKNKNSLVSTKDGFDSYSSAANDLTVVIKGDVTVSFDTKGGTEIDSIVVKYGETLTRPEEPKKSGYEFSGWHKDAEGTQEWDFETDTVVEDTTLYAKWTEKANPTILWLLLIAILVTVVILLILKRKKEKEKT